MDSFCVKAYIWHYLKLLFKSDTLPCVFVKKMQMQLFETRYCNTDARKEYDDPKEMAVSIKTVSFKHEGKRNLSALRCGTAW